MVKATSGMKRTFFATMLVAIISILAGCAENESEIRSTDSVYPFRSQSTFAPVLKRCALANTVEDSCELQELPFIGDGATTPTVEQVMDRVLVTHDWMGARFEQALRNAPDDILLTLFSSTTSILIGSEVRPSFYITVTGGIQLDPAHLWVTNAEKRAVSTASDFRSDFGADLQFEFIARIANELGDRIVPFYSLEDNTKRDVREMEIPLYRLLYHELTHANDFMPRQEIANVDPNLSVFEAIGELRNDWLSDKLITNYPNISDTLVQLANVSFRGAEASVSQQSLNSVDVGQQMALDGAMRFYSYSSQREDLALLVESVLMGYHFDARINVGFVQKPLDEGTSCAEYLVGWGERNRLASPLVNVRARFAAELLLDNPADVLSFLDNELGVSESMAFGVDWCTNQPPSPMISANAPSLFSSAAARSRSLGIEEHTFQEMLDNNSVEHPVWINQR